MQSRWEGRVEAISASLLLNPARNKRRPRKERAAQQARNKVHVVGRNRRPLRGPGMDGRHQGPLGAARRHPRGAPGLQTRYALVITTYGHATLAPGNRSSAADRPRAAAAIRDVPTSDMRHVPRAPIPTEETGPRAWLL
ncbi:hypothetical protein HPB50_021974 [Hyalomma asiaticum]|uniref:Uncharacterized protein n=1 Tax=Hyalomma asiaticum TaxID=266040 RepID=A0ACB7TSM0_HYAAI|nr:hypothetical protein HPB50_021974 [Hyalomma asiaticum]